MSRTWHPISKFPTPGIKLIVQLTNGQSILAIRNQYASSYQDDPQFTTLDGEPIPTKTIQQWTIK